MACVSEHSTADDTRHSTRTAPASSGAAAAAAGPLAGAPTAATSRAVIDLDALARNARVLADVAGTPWLAVVKADAYGHGIEAVATTCLAAGATWLGTAQVAEALHLRALLDARGTSRPEPGPDTVPTPDAPRLLAWLVPFLTPEQAAAPGSALCQALAADIDLSASTPAQVEALAAAARVEGRPARVHLKADTGMSRAGAVAEDVPALAAAARRAEEEGFLDVVGLWSHLSRADEPDSGSTEEHLARFRAAEASVRAAGLNPRVRHLAATGGLLWHPDARLDLVRAGIGLYGLSPDPSVATSSELGLSPVMRLEAPLVQVKRIPAGRAVSYGGTWTAPTDRWLGLVPLGYSDGLPRAAASAGPVSVGGLRTTVVGKVCMDQVVIDLGPAADTEGEPVPAPAAPGDVAVLWGDPGAPGADPATPTADDWAAVCGTINYEIVTRLGARVPRVTAGDGLPASH
nr:alanine racemase [Actinomyces radicidentis]